MRETVRSVYWEAPEHHHIEKSSDWYWILGILAVASAVSSIIFGNILFGLVILLGATVMMLYSVRQPRILRFEISNRGIRIENYLYPFSVLQSFYLDEDHRNGPQLIVKPLKLFSQLLIIPIPETYIEEIERIIAPRLLEEHLEESLSHQLLETLGF